MRCKCLVPPTCTVPKHICAEEGGKVEVATSEKGRMVDALATRADEGRGNAAKSHGEPLAGRSVDIRMGQPPSRDGEGLLPCGGEASGGTETSKYPEEKRQFP